MSTSTTSTTSTTRSTTSNFGFVKELEQCVHPTNRCVGLRRIVNKNAWNDLDQIRIFALGDVAKENMTKSIQMVCDALGMSRLECCYMLESVGYTTLPKLIQYMADDTRNARCDTALQQIMKERVWPTM